MKKKLVFLVLLIILCSVSVFAANWAIISDHVTEELEDDPITDGCSYSPDGILYMGNYISFRHICDQHDRDYYNKVDRSVADDKLRDGIYDVLVRNNVPRPVAYNISRAYYSGVRTFGWMFY